MSNSVNEPAIILTKNGITIVIDGNSYSIQNDHTYYSKIIEAVKEKDWAKLSETIDVARRITEYGSAKGVSVANGIVYYNGNVLHNTITDRIISMQGEGFDINPMIKFLENLLQNPSKTAINELYLFLQTGNMPITTDGHFLAYKKVRNDFKDIYSGTMDNSPGKVVKMNRRDVCDNRDKACESGLHFCSLKYLPQYSGDSGSDKIVIVKINPANVVSIPSDYANTKGRTCEYLVVQEYKGSLEKDVFTKSVQDHLDDFSEKFEKLEQEFENISDKEGADDEEADDNFQWAAVPNYVSKLVGKKFKGAQGTYKIIDVVNSHCFTKNWSYVIEYSKDGPAGQHNRSYRQVLKDKAKNTSGNFHHKKGRAVSVKS